MEYPKRKPVRLKGYDYSQNGAYFITVCTWERKCILSDITVGEGLAPPAKYQLTQVGKLVQEQLLALEARYPTVQIEKYVIMPNHIHAILQIREGETGGASPSPTLMDAVRVLKSITTRMYHGLGTDSNLWQRSFYDHVIRSDADWREIWEYIENNPAKWAEDRFYVPDEEAARTT